MILMHILREEKFYFSCTFVGERYSIREIHILRRRRYCVNKEILFCLCFFIFVFLFALWCFELCWISMLCCSHCIVFVYQVVHMFHIMFTWSQFTCYIILVLLFLALPWGSNVFCASFSSYRYICSKFITAPMIHDRGSDMIGGERTMLLLCS